MAVDDSLRIDRMGVEAGGKLVVLVHEAINSNGGDGNGKA